MPTLERPDGVQIDWRETGEGPGLLISNGFNLTATERLVEMLAENRRVVTFHPRGLGRSSLRGPYDLATGVADVEALIEECGPVEAVFGTGDGAHRAMRVAERRADLVGRIVITSTGLGRSRSRSQAEGGGFGGSPQVLSALMSLIRTDYRSGLRSMIANSGALSEDVVRDRVEALAEEIPQEAALGYLDSWIAASSVDVARRLGPRLTILAYRGNDWFPLSMFESMRDELTEACFELVEDGPLNRPDLTAAVLLRLSEPAKA